MKKIVCLILIGASLFLFLNGCSSMKNLFGWMKFWNSDTRISKPTDKDIARFASAMRPHPGNPNSHYLLACNYQNQGKHKAAIEEFNKVVYIDPNNAKAYNGMGVSYDMLKKFTQAVESYKKALIINPKLDYVYNNLGYSYLLQKNFDEAIISFKNAIALNENEKQFHDNLGLAYAEKGEFESAMNEFKLAGDETKANYNIAQIYHKKGLYEMAQKYYTASLASDPSYMPAKIGLESVSSMLRIFKVAENAEVGKVRIADNPVAGNAEQKAEVVAPVSQPVVEKVETEKVVTTQPVASKPVKVIERSRNEVIERSRNEKDVAAPKQAPVVSAKAETVTPVILPVAKKIEAEKVVTAVQSVASKPVKVIERSRNEVIERSRNEVIERSRNKEIATAPKLAPVNNAKADVVAPVILPVAKKVEAEKVITANQPPVNKSESKPVKVIERSRNEVIERSRNKEVILTSKQTAVINTKEETMKLVDKPDSKEIKVVKSDNNKESAGADEKNSVKVSGIEISNGNGIRHMARMVGRSLKEKGHSVVRLTNADNFRHARTDIYYQRGYKKEAVRLAKQLPVFQYLKETKKLDRASVKVKVLIGKDLIQYSKSFSRKNFADNSSKFVK